MEDPFLNEALAWARKLLNEKDLLQLDNASQVGVYASYVQSMASKKNIEVSEKILQTSTDTRNLSENILKSSRTIERLSIVVMVLTLVVAFFATAGYFAQIPTVGYTYAPIIAFAVTFAIFQLLKREVARRK